MVKVINYKNFEWYVLHESEDTTTLFMKDLLSKDIVSDICDDTSMYSCNYVAHIKDNEKYSWETSYVKKVLNDKFLENYLDKNDLVKMNEDYVRLLKLEEIDWENDIFKSDNCYSLMTKMGSSNVAYVNSSGDAYGYNAGSYWLAVRPVIEVKKSVLKPKKMTVAQICDVLGYEVEIIK